MTAAAITDTRAVAHDMQANAKRGLLWAIGLSLLAHLAVLTIQVGGESFGWRTPNAEATLDASQRFNARLVARAPVESPKLELMKVSPDVRPVDSQRSTTVTVTAPPTLPRAEELDPPIPKAEAPTPPIDRVVPVIAPAPKVEIKEQPPAPQPLPKEPELFTPKPAELKTPPPVVTPLPPAPTPTPPLPVPVPVVEVPPPKPEVKAAPPVPTAITPPPLTAAPETTPVVPEPVKAAATRPAQVPVGAPVLPTPFAAPTATVPPVAAPVLPATPTPIAPAAPAPIAAPTAPTAPAAQQAAPILAAPAAPTTAATPVLTGSAPSNAPAAAPAASAATLVGGAPGASRAASGSPPASGASGAAGAAGVSSARPGAVVSLPSPRTGDGTVAAPAGSSGDRAPASALPAGNIDGFDPYKSRTAVARDAARDLNNQRGRAPPSVAPSLTERERFARDIENARRRDCKDVAGEIGLLAIPTVIGGVLFDKGCQIR